MSLYTTVCYDGQIRFANYTDYYDNETNIYKYGGRVEVCSGDTYYPVCDEGWTDNDAAVVCNNRGYSPPYYRQLYHIIVYNNNNSNGSHSIRAIDHAPR